MDGAQDGKALSYQRIQEWPSLKLAISNSLQNKATFIWTAATAVIGIAVPLGLNSPSVLSSNIGWLLLVALIVYVILSGLAASTFYPWPSLNLVIDPTILREQFWGLTGPEFVHEMSLHIENACFKNDSTLIREGWTVRGMFLLVVIQMLFLFTWIGLPHWDLIW